MNDWLVHHDDGLTLNLHVQPGAKSTGFAGRHGDAMKIRLAAPPVDGKANKALLAFVADYCGVSKSAVVLVSGHSSRAKRVRISGLDATAMERLRELA